MHFIRPTISTQRLQRFHRWALLWLTWFAAVIEYGSAFAPLSRQAKTLAHKYLDQIERLIVNIVIIRAGAAIPRGAVKSWRSHALKYKQTGFRRAVLGVKLWRALRQRDLTQRIAALSQDMAAMIARAASRAGFRFRTCWRSHFPYRGSNNAPGFTTASRVSAGGRCSPIRMSNSQLGPQRRGRFRPKRG